LSQNIHGLAQLTLARAGIFHGSTHTGLSQEFFFQLEPSQAVAQLKPARAELYDKVTYECLLKQEISVAVKIKNKESQ
jgi:hypothetical protein